MNSWENADHQTFQIWVIAKQIILKMINLIQDFRDSCYCLFIFIYLYLSLMGFCWKGFYLKIAEWLLSSYQMTSSWNIKDGMRKVWDINKAVILKIQLKPTQYMNITSTMMKHV